MLNSTRTALVGHASAGQSERSSDASHRALRSLRAPPALTCESVASPLPPRLGGAGFSLPIRAKLGLSFLRSSSRQYPNPAPPADLVLVFSALISAFSAPLR